MERPQTRLAGLSPGARSHIRGQGPPPRVVIQDVAPEIDSGRFAIKRALGEKIVVSARVFADGRDSVAAAVRYRRRPESAWHEAAMAPRADDTWSASFLPDALGSYEYTVLAWIDRFATWRKEIVAKLAAREDCEQEFAEGAGLVGAAARDAASEDARALRRSASALRGGSPNERSRAALDAGLSRLMARCGERDDLCVYDRALRASVERERARFGAWYEMFPRSAGGDPKRGATFREAEERLDAIAGMGFDVLYLPPIHPIGSSFRKGPNNAPRCGPDDPGSPWAIGSEAGGHEAVHPGLGTLADFDHFLAAAESAGLEIALDVAFQCSPDHPYVREHPDWFHRRPDGRIKCAENPPKKYEDIYPLDFECGDWRALWKELTEVVLFWARRGVRAFRADNPHTKPFRFWKALIHAVHAEFPDAIFLGEAFARPSVLKQLAKCGFSQSYTYFTWRNTKTELTDYFTELTRTEVREYLRPNLFVNTPDIFHGYLQAGGKPAHQARLALAATLGASYGIYGPPFELCEGRFVPGTEEYSDSEKYQIRRWDWDRPGNIKGFISRMNRIRRENAALRRDETLQFLPIDNDQLIAYAKTTEDLSNVLVVVVNLDPRNVQSGWLQVPWSRWGLSEAEPHPVDDLLQGARYAWKGAANFIRLDPADCPAHVLRLRRPPRREPTAPTLEVGGAWADLLEGASRNALEAAILPAFLARQRWYAGKTREIRAAEISDAARLRSHPTPVFLCLVDAVYADGGRETYVLPLSVVTGGAAERIQETFPEAILASLDSGGRRAALCDGIADDDFCRILLETLKNQGGVATERGRLEAFKTEIFSRIKDVPAPPAIARGSAEQSNSSLRYGNVLILKLFRRLQPGVNPDLEIGLSLTRRPRFDRVPKVAGALELHRPGEEPRTLAMAQELIANQGDGWSRALKDLRRYFESVSSSRSSRSGAPAVEVVDSSLHYARILGRRTAEMHRALADGAGDPAFSSEPFTAEDGASLARRVRDSADRAFKTLRLGLDALPPARRAEASRLLDLRAALDARLQPAPIAGLPQGKIRCHGDYHLGQVLTVDDDVYILDFEGEPGRPLAQRRLKQSPLRDVAGMLRSFDYAAHMGLHEFARGDDASQARLEPWGRAWREWTGGAFLQEYRRGAADAGFLPAKPGEFDALLDLFVLEKAFYELVYELDDRPRWVGIPLEGLLDLLEPGGRRQA